MPPIPAAILAGSVVQAVTPSPLRAGLVGPRRAAVCGLPIPLVGVKPGDLIAFTGAPHRRVEVKLPEPEKQWGHATSINPCGRLEGQ